MRAANQRATMTISTSTQELLKAHAGRGFSDDPALTARHKIRLLQNTSKLPKHGQGQPGLFLQPDEAATCTSRLRVVLGKVYSTYVERSPDGKPAGREHLHLPADAEKDSSGFGWRLSNGNMLETEARLAGLFNGLEAELDLKATGMKVARALNTDAKAKATKHGVPLFGLAYEFGSTELSNDRGQTYHGVTFQFIGAVGEPEGPSEEEVLRASALCDVVEAAIAAAKREAEDRRSAPWTSSGLPPRNVEPRPLITSGAAALRVVEAPPPVEAYDGPDDDIPF
jgi:hypothetical protein